MAFDSGFLAASLHEISSFAGVSRVEKIHQPRNDEITFSLRSKEGTRTLLLRCGAQDPRIVFTSSKRENPPVPPSFCMLLRKHLQGALFLSVSQPGFERVAEFVFSCRDEMGFDRERRLYAEITGRNGNLILTDGTPKILGAMRTVDFSTSRLRQVLPGMTYGLPPAQEGRRDPLAETGDGFAAAAESAGGDTQAARFINSAYLGICPAVAREIVLAASGDISATLSEVPPGRLYAAFSSVFSRIAENRYEFTSASLPGGNGSGKSAEYSYIPLLQYGAENLKRYGSASEMLDEFYAVRDRASALSSTASDLSHVLKNSIARLSRKLDIQRGELAECEGAEEIRRDADLLTANLYRLKSGDSSVMLTDWSEQRDDGGFAEKRITLDPRLTPSANAQRLYKKYAKLKTAKRELTKQTATAEEELEYLLTVRDSLERAESLSDVTGIRSELIRGGYIKTRGKEAPLSAPAKPAEYLTSGGFTVLCGRNNLMNDELTLRTAAKTDIWFHVKGMPGSHVILRRGEREREPSDTDLTEACAVAAQNSGAKGPADVDYTEARYVSKPRGAKPGHVIYRNYRTAHVDPDPAAVAAMKKN